MAHDGVALTHARKQPDGAWLCAACRSKGKPRGRSSRGRIEQPLQTSRPTPTADAAHVQSAPEMRSDAAQARHNQSNAAASDAAVAQQDAAAAAAARSTSQSPLHYSTAHCTCMQMVRTHPILMASMCALLCDVVAAAPLSHTFHPPCAVAASEAHASPRPHLQQSVAALGWQSLSPAKRVCVMAMLILPLYSPLLPLLLSPLLVCVMALLPSLLPPLLLTPPLHPRLLPLLPLLLPPLLGPPLSRLLQQQRGKLILSESSLT